MATAVSRFKPPTSDVEMETISKGFVPPNTRKNTSWALNVFFDWKMERNTTDKSNLCPEDLLENPETELLNFWLSRFVTEVRNKKGEHYPPKSIHQILAGLQRCMLDKTPDGPRFLDRNNAVFRQLHRTCDSIYRDLHRQGIGANVSHAVPFSAEEEKTLWSSHILSDSDPKGLQRAVFYYVGKHFCVRGGAEQRSLGPSYFIRSSRPDSYTYVEHGSKNRSGGLDQLQLENKSVCCVAVPEMRPVCLVYLLDKYLSKLPEFAFKNDIFYCRAKPCPPNPTAPWYENAPVGKNKLSGLVSEMCAEANLSRRTNHALRATGATTLFQSHVPEKIIQKITGHRSLKALRMYETTSAEQQEAVSKVMLSTEKTTFDDKLKENKTTKPTSKPKKTSLPRGIERIFGDISNNRIGNLTINIGQIDDSEPYEDEEFDLLSQSIDLNVT